MKYKVLPLTAVTTYPYGCWVCPWEWDCKPQGGICSALEEKLARLFPKVQELIYTPPAGPEGSEYVIQWPTLRRKQKAV